MGKQIILYEMGPICTALYCAVLAVCVIILAYA